SFAFLAGQIVFQQSHSTQCRFTELVHSVLRAAITSHVRENPFAMKTAFSRWLNRRSLTKSGKSSCRRSLCFGRAQLSLEALEHRLVPTSVVSNINDSGPGSLRQAIIDANAASGACVIDFNIADSGVQDIQLASALPDITNSVTIDGTSQPGYGGTPLIELNGAGAGSGVSGLTLAGPNITVVGLDINGFSGDG